MPSSDTSISSASWPRIRCESSCIRSLACRAAECDELSTTAALLPETIVTADQQLGVFPSFLRRTASESALSPGTSAGDQTRTPRCPASKRGSRGSLEQRPSNARFSAENRSHQVLYPRSNTLSALFLFFELLSRQKNQLGQRLGAVFPDGRSLLEMHASCRVPCRVGRG